MSAQQQVDELLKSSGAVLIRQGKHLVYRLPNNRTFVRAKSTSDRYSHHNDLADLRRSLGIENTGNGEGQRREKVIKQKQPSQREQFDKPKTFNNAFADKLRVVGLVEDRLRGDIEFLEAELNFLRLDLASAETESHELKQELGEMVVEVEELRARVCESWWCRLKRWINRII